MTPPKQDNQTGVCCPECKSSDIFRWFCGEYTCQECHKLFGICEEPQRYRTLRRLGKA